MKIVCFTLAILLLHSCRKNNEETKPADGAKLFYPTRIGSYITYQVDSVVYNGLLNKIDTIRFQLREVVESSFLDNIGRLSFRIERYRRSTDTTNWEFSNVIWVQPLSNSVQRIDENQRVIILALPVGYDVLWNRNELNNNPRRLCYYESIGNSKILGSYSFKNTVTVTQIPVADDLEEITNVETYAMGIGLAFKQKSEIETQCDIKNGYRLQYRILDHN